MKTRKTNSATTLYEVLDLLNHEQKDLYSNIYVGKNYSLKELIEDVLKIEEKQISIFKDIVEADEGMMRYHIGDRSYNRVLKMLGEKV